MKINKSIFRAYDIRGKYPQEISDKTGELIAKGYLKTLDSPKKIVIGRDVRESSQKLSSQVVKALSQMGMEVVNIGQVSTEVLYFAVNQLKAAGGIMLTASHNPAGWAGLKMVKEKAIPLKEEEIKEIRKTIENKSWPQSQKEGKIKKENLRPAYLKKLEGLINTKEINPFKVVINALNGVGGEVAGPLLDKLPIKPIKVGFEPDGKFPKGEPDPLLPKRQKETSQITKEREADLGVSFDGDGDRCLFFDEKGQFIRGSYIVALLAKHLLAKSKKKEKIITDCRLIWPAQKVVKAAGGKLIINRPGHSFLKQAMRDNKALFAGEVSGHFYYRDFYYADSGLLTLLYFLEFLSGQNKPLSKIIAPFRKQFPAIDETNFKVKDKQKLLKKVENKYGKKGEVDKTDGVSVGFDRWRFNLRASQTEEKIRLNLEAKDKEILNKKEKELIKFIKDQGGKRA